MTNLEIFNLVIDKACEITNVRRDVLISGKKQHHVVETRVLASEYLWRIGFSSDEIAFFVLTERNGVYPDIDRVKSTAKGIDKGICTYDDRRKDSYKFGLSAAQLSEFCRQKYGEMYIHGMKELPK